MAFGTQDEPDEVMNEINMTSTSGVMLISFITSSGSSWVPKAMILSLS